MKIEDIAFLIVVVPIGLRLIWELISEAQKKYWGYLWQTRKDHKKGWYNRKWTWTFRDGVGREK